MRTTLHGGERMGHLYKNFSPSERDFLRRKRLRNSYSSGSYALCNPNFIIDYERVNKKRKARDNKILNINYADVISQFRNRPLTVQTKNGRRLKAKDIIQEIRK